MKIFRTIILYFCFLGICLVYSQEKVDQGQRSLIREKVKALGASKQEIRAKATNELVKIGVKAVPEVIKALQNKNWKARVNAMYVLGSIQPPASSVLVDIIKAYQDEHYWVRRNVVYALGRIAPNDPRSISIFLHALKTPASVVPHLVKVLKDSDDVSFKNATIAIRNIGPKAEAAIPILAKNLNNEKVFRQAISTLEAIGDKAIPAFGQFLKLSKKREVKTQIISTLGRMKHNALPVLAELLKHKSASIRRATIRSIGEAGASNPQRAAPIIIPLLKSQDSKIRSSAIYALGRIKPKTSDVVFALIEAAKDTYIRGKALDILSKMGPIAAPAIPMMISILKSRDLLERSYAITAFQNMGSKAISAAPTMINVSQKAAYKNNLARMAKALGNMGPKVIPILTKAFLNTNENTRKMAALAFYQSGPLAASNMGVLISVLKDKNRNVRAIASKAIHAGIKHLKDKSDLPIASLCQALKDENSVVRFYTSRSLEKLGAPAVPYLLEVFQKEENLQQQKEIMVILGKIGSQAAGAIPAIEKKLQQYREFMKTGQDVMQKIKGNKKHN